MVDAAGEPHLFTSVRNAGAAGGTLASAGAARPAVGYLECGGVARRCFAGDGSGTYQDWSAAKSLQRFLHDGTGCTIFIVPRVSAFSSSRALLASCALGLATVGIGLSYNADGSVVFQTYDGSGVGKSLFLQTAADVLAAGVPGVLTIRHGTALSPKDGQILCDGVEVASADYTRTPAAGDALATLRLGSLTSGSLWFDGQLCELIIYQRLLTDAEEALVRAYLADQWQGQSELTKLAPTFFFDFSVTDCFTVDDGNAEAGDQIDRIRDVGGQAHDGVQTTDNKQGTATTLDGNAAVDLDGAADCYSVGAGVGWPAGTDHSVIAVIDQDDAMGSLDYLLDVETGRLIIAPLGGAAQTGWNDGAWRNAGAAAAGDQVLEWHLDATATTGEVFRNGVLVGSVTYTPRAIGGAVGLFSNYGGVGQFLDGKCALFWHKADGTAPLSGADLYAARAEIQARFPTTWPWSPLVVPDCSGWWDYSDATTLSFTGARLTQWDDKSGRGRNLVEVGGSGPTNEGGGWGGADCPLFDGAGDYMTADAVATDFSGDDLPLTLIMLIEWVSTSSHDYPWSFGNSADAQHFFMAYNYNGGGTLRPTRKGGGADTQKTAFTSNTITGRAVRSVVFDGTDVWTYLNKTVGINGVDLDTAPATLDMFTIGANRRGGGAGVAQHANIRVPEMMLYKRAISNAEREAIEDYLIAKWGVS